MPCQNRSLRIHCITALDDRTQFLEQNFLETGAAGGVGSAFDWSSDRRLLQSGRQRRGEKIVGTQSQPLAVVLIWIANPDNVGGGWTEVAGGLSQARDFTEQTIAIEEVSDRHFTGLRLDRFGHMNQEIPSQRLGMNCKLVCIPDLRRLGRVAF